MIPRRHNINVNLFSYLVFVGALGFGCSTGTTATVQHSSARCAGCHLPEYQSVTHPPHAGVLPTTCGTCHTEKGWHPSRLQHSFALDGAHAKADCFKCHRRLGLNSLPTLKFEGTPKECIACHTSDQERVNSRMKNHANFPDACENCHSTEAWKPTSRHKSTPTKAAEPAAPSSSTAAANTPTQAPVQQSRKGGRRSTDAPADAL